MDGKNVSKSTSLLAFTVGCEQSFLSGEVRRFAQGIRGDSQSSARHPSINFLFRKFFFLLFDSRDELHKKEGQLVIFIHGISLYLIRWMFSLIFFKRSSAVNSGDVVFGAFIETYGFNWWGRKYASLLKLYCFLFLFLFFSGRLSAVVFEAGAREIRRNTRARERVAFLQELSRA